MPFCLDVVAITADGVTDHLKLLISRSVSNETLTHIDKAQQNGLQPSEKTGSQPDQRYHEDQFC
jgi:hypothetical protein